MGRARRMTAVLSGLALLACAPAAARAQPGPGQAPTDEERLALILDHTGRAVARYHSELFRIAFTETLRHEELSKESRSEQGERHRAGGGRRERRGGRGAE